MRHRSLSGRVRAWTRQPSCTSRLATAAPMKPEAPVIHSDGRFIRDYLYVDDAAAAHLLLAEKLSEIPDLRGQAFNISNETRLTVLELVQRILKLMDSPLQPLVQNQAKNEIKNQYLSARKARQALGWQPLFTMDEGLKLTVDWYRGYFERQGNL